MRNTHMLVVQGRLRRDNTYQYFFGSPTQWLSACAPYGAQTRPLELTSQITVYQEVGLAPHSATQLLSKKEQGHLMAVADYLRDDAPLIDCYCNLMVIRIKRDLEAHVRDVCAMVGGHLPHPLINLKYGCNDEVEVVLSRYMSSRTAEALLKELTR